MKTALAKIKKGLAYCAYDGKSVGYYEKDFKLLEEKIKKLEHLEFVQELIEKIRIKGVLLLAIDRKSEFSDVYYDFDDDKLVCVNHYESEERGEEWDNVTTTLFLCDYGTLWREYREEDGEKYTYWYN